MKMLFVTLALVLGSAQAMARSPIMPVCTDGIAAAEADNFVKQVLLRKLPAEHDTVEIRKVEMLSMSHNITGQEVSTYRVTWGHKQGELSFENWLLKLTLVESGTGGCIVASAVNEDVSVD